MAGVSFGNLRKNVQVQDAATARGGGAGVASLSGPGHIVGHGVSTDDGVVPAVLLEEGLVQGRGLSGLLRQHFPQEQESSCASAGALCPVAALQTSHRVHVQRQAARGCEGDHETDVRETVQETVPVPGVQDVSDAHQVPGQREATPTCGHQDAAPLLPDIRLFPQGEKLRRTNWYPRDSYPTRRNNASGNATLFLTLPLTQCRRRKCLRFRWQFRLLRQPVVCSHADEGFGRLLPGR